MRLSFLLLVLGAVIFICGCHNPLWVLVGGAVLFGAWIRAEVQG